jgi:hypothetical protein
VRGSVGSRELRRRSVTAPKLASRGVTKRTLSQWIRTQLRRRAAQGAPGPRGPEGATGPRGPGAVPVRYSTAAAATPAFATFLDTGGLTLEASCEVSGRDDDAEPQRRLGPGSHASRDDHDRCRHRPEHAVAGGQRQPPDRPARGHHISGRRSFHHRRLRAGRGSGRLQQPEQHPRLPPVPLRQRRRRDRHRQLLDQRRHRARLTSAVTPPRTPHTGAARGAVSHRTLLRALESTLPSMSVADQGLM